MNTNMSAKGGSALGGKNIVVIGGGTGTSTLIQGLNRYRINLSVVVSSWDDGGSTGRLRKQLGVFPPGDIRQCLVSLANTDRAFKQFFNYRFNTGELKGHAVGNILLAGLEKITGSIAQSVALASKILNVTGAVLPVTLKPTKLTAILKNGKKIVGEHNIDKPRKVKSEKLKVKSLRLTPNGSVNPKAVEAIKKANIIVFGPGDLYTSILPNLVVKGIREAVDASKAKKILVTNLVTKPGQTDGFSPDDFVREINKYLGKKKLNAVLINTQKPEAQLLSKYRKQGSELIYPKIHNLKNIKIIKANLLSSHIHKKVKGDTLVRSFLRHDSNKLALLIYDL